MGRVTRAVCDTVGEEDQRCEQMKDLYAGIGAFLLLAIAGVAIAKALEE